MSHGWLLAFAAALAWGSSDFVAARVAGHTTLRRVLAVSMVTGMVLAAVATAVTAADSPAGWAPSGSLVWWSVLAGATEVGGYACLYRALSLGPMGVAASLAGLGVLVPVTVGVLAGADLTGWRGTGLATAVVGIGLLGGGGRADLRCLLPAVTSAGCFGVSTVALARAAAESAPAAVLLTRTSAVLVLVPVALLAWRRSATASAGASVAALLATSTPGPIAGTLTGRRTGVFLACVLVGVLDVAGTFAFASSTTLVPLPLAAMTSSTYPLVTALLARAILTERLPPLVRLGGVATVVGSALLAM